MACPNILGSVGQEAHDPVIDRIVDTKIHKFSELGGNDY